MDIFLDHDHTKHSSVGIFSADGSLHQTNDKSVIAEELRKLQFLHDESEEQTQLNGGGRKTIIFHVVNKINIKKAKLKDCMEFARQFVDMIKREVCGYHEVRVVFDRNE